MILKPDDLETNLSFFFLGGWSVFVFVFVFDGHKFEQAPGVGDGQVSLVCCSPWDHKESDTTEGLNWVVTFLIGR